MTLNQVITSYDPTKLTVDPNDGAVTVSFTYAAVDAAGKVDPTPATVTMPFTDHHAERHGVRRRQRLASQNGGEAGHERRAGCTSTCWTTRARGGHDERSTPAGTYTFTNVTPSTTYALQLTTNAGTVGNPPPAIALPAGWVTTGENASGAPDGMPTASSRGRGHEQRHGQNFGIEQLPNTTG